MKVGDLDGGGHDGRPATYRHPRDVLGVTEGGPEDPDHLLDRLREVHGDPRYDIAPELVRQRMVPATITTQS
jgi:hypothetical protein